MLTLNGTLVRYGSAGPHVALACRKPSIHPSRAVILIGGLTDGLLFAPYVAPLSEELSRRDWLVVHASIQSSWQGYGTGCLDRDAEDLRLLTQYLGQHMGVRGVVLWGHSTGCQDAVRYVQRFGPAGNPLGEGPDAVPELLATVLQAPVSDHEWLSGYSDLAPIAALAREMVAAGRGQEVVCRLHIADNAPITAARFLSLYELGGDDDMFSEGLPADAVQRILAPVGDRPCLVMVSGADECGPPIEKVSARATALQQAIGPRAELKIVTGAPHNLEGFEAEAVELACAFLEQCA